MNNLSPSEPTQIGRYQLIGRLGRGGMGTVYLGQDDTGQRVAVKVINAEYSQHEQFRVRFRREAESARRVRRFCTAAVLDSDLEGDLLYVVTEYVEGPNLHDAIQRTGPLRGSSLDALAVGVATALTAIHSAGIVHRDLKPSNVLLSPVGPRVIDFGIARALDTLSGITGTGELMGTPRYMAPEVLRGAPAAPACDVFSWGCLVAFAASGRAPFGGESLPSIVYQVLNTEPSLDSMEPPLRTLVAAALEKDPERRPTAQQILDQMVGRTTPERAEHTVVQAWQRSPTLQGQAPTLPGQPPTRHGPPPTGHLPAGPPTGAHAPYQGQPPTAAHQGTVPAGSPTYLGTTPAVPRHQGAGTPLDATWRAQGPPEGGRPADPAARRRRLIGIGVAGVVLFAVAGFGLRALLAPSGPPTDLSFLYRDDFNESGTGWSGSEYTGKEYGMYGYAPGGFYAVDVNDEGSERIEKAPIPFVPEQPATPDPSATPTPTTPQRLLLTVTATLRSSKGPGEYGLFCRADGEYRQSRYEFLLSETGEARIRRVTKGTGGNLTAAAATGITKNTPAKVQVECAKTAEGVQLTMWVDGARVQSFLDNSGSPSSLPNGDVGFLARVPEKSGSSLGVSFDDFTVQGPASASSPR
ncbi:serine/threonine-protein kinase [Sphaerisporangium corydalis]|uniref:Protein kinase n=1 Tax=Sphaerisporangium corydalis TaxID=1441875 RepID=A0ABV9EPW3_9ACTN|nr:serine/threonine-protein kinase [Sphaerisporangium corydalis]